MIIEFGVLTRLKPRAADMEEKVDYHGTLTFNARVRYTFSVYRPSIVNRAREAAYFRGVGWPCIESKLIFRLFLVFYTTSECIGKFGYKLK